jgi:hypothetical protein
LYFSCSSFSSFVASLLGFASSFSRDRNCLFEGFPSTALSCETAFLSEHWRKMNETFPKSEPILFCTDLVVQGAAVKGLYSTIAGVCPKLVGEAFAMGIEGLQKEPVFVTQLLAFSLCL